MAFLLSCRRIAFVVAACVNHLTTISRIRFLDVHTLPKAFLLTILLRIWRLLCRKKYKSYCYAGHQRQ